jgi:hypothetical protein
LVSARLSEKYVSRSFASAKPKTLEKKASRQKTTAKVAPMKRPENPRL